MIVVGLDVIQGSVPGKVLLNDDAVVFFPMSRQHREMKSQGLSYEDDYRGNAVAGTFQPGRVDIRFHSQFSDERIRALWSRLLTDPSLSFLHGWELHYQGRRIA